MRARAVLLRSSVAGLVLALASAGCSDDDPTATPGPTASSASEASEPGGEPGGDVSGDLVLPDVLSVSEDGDEVLADCWEGVCRWATGDGSLTDVAPGSHLAVSPDWSLRAGADGAVVLVVDSETGETVRELEGLAEVDVMAFSPDGSRLAAAGDGRVVVWTVDDGEALAGWPEPDVAALAFSPDGDRLASSGADGVQVRALPSGSRVAGWTGDASPGLAWSPDGRWLAGAGEDATPTVWDARRGKPAARLDGVRLEQVAFGPDSRTLGVTAQDDTVARLWRPALEEGGRPGPDDPPRVRELVGHLAPPEAVVFAPDGSRLYTVSGSDGILAWDVANGQVALEMQRPER